MQSTVEILLSIVKQENTSNKNQLWPVSSADIKLDYYRKNVSENVMIHLHIETNCQLNFPLSVVNMIIKNLLDNAILFTTIGTIETRINNHQIEMVDSGTGLTEDVFVEHGLGLLIVRRLCSAGR